MKVALITDTHFGARSDSVQMLQNADKSFKWFYDTIEEQGINTVIHLGDLFERRKYLNFLTAKYCRECFAEPAKQRGITVHLIAGNHDIYYKNTNVVNALSEIIEGKYDNIKVYLDPEVINIAGLDIQLIPWITESNYNAAIGAIKKPKADILMGHLEIEGFEYFRGIMADDGVDPAIFNGFDRVYSGHFHTRGSRNNITYLGAFGEYSWIDYNDPRGFNIFDTETRQVTFYQNKNHMFKTLTYDDSQPYILEKIHNTDFSMYTGLYTKVLCVQKNDPYLFDQFFDMLYKAEPVEISVIEGAASVGDINDINEDENESEDTLSVINKTIDSLNNSNLDSNKLKSYIQKIYVEANNLRV